MYISMNSLALLLMNATPLSPATARAISVLPLPVANSGKGAADNTPNTRQHHSRNNQCIV
jgi:hypothetical protein